MPKLFETLRERLLVAGIAPRHIRRYLAELGDHLADLRAQGLEESAALARLGNLDDLAKPMMARPEFRSWIARWPWATFVVGPVLAVISTATAFFAVLVGIALAFGWPRGGIEPMWFQIAAQTAVAVQVFVAPVLVGWALSALAITRRLPPVWPLIGLTVFALLSGTFGMEVIFPKVLGDHGELRIGFGWGFLGPLDRMEKSQWHWIANLLLIVGPYLARQRGPWRLPSMLASVR